MCCASASASPLARSILLRAGPNASVHAYSAAQVKAAMDATLRLGGENYVFWGGREGYHTLLNTDLKCAGLFPLLPNALVHSPPALRPGLANGRAGTLTH